MTQLFPDPRFPEARKPRSLNPIDLNSSVSIRLVMSAWAFDQHSPGMYLDTVGKLGQGFAYATGIVPTYLPTYDDGVIHLVGVNQAQIEYILHNT